MVLAVRLLVEIEPEVPEILICGEEHAVLLADDHVITELVPLVIKAGVADALAIVEIAVVGVLEEEPPEAMLAPPHEARPTTMTSDANITPSRTLDLNAVLIDMILSV